MCLCRLNPGDDSGRRCELFQETRDALAGRSDMQSVRRRFLFTDSMGCMALELKVAACLLCADLGSSFEMFDVRRGGEVKGVS